MCVNHVSILCINHLCILCINHVCTLYANHVHIWCINHGCILYIIHGCIVCIYPVCILDINPVYIGYQSWVYTLYQSHCVHSVSITVCIDCQSRVYIVCQTLCHRLSTGVCRCDYHYLYTARHRTDIVWTQSMYLQYTEYRITPSTKSRKIIYLH